MRVSWTTQNDATDADGFLLEGEASFVAELEVLASMGCPDTDVDGLSPTPTKRS